MATRKQYDHVRMLSRLRNLLVHAFLFSGNTLRVGWFYFVDTETVVRKTAANDNTPRGGKLGRRTCGRSRHRALHHAARDSAPRSVPDGLLLLRPSRPGERRLRRLADEQ